MITLATLCVAAALGSVEVTAQHIEVTLDPQRHHAAVSSYLAVSGAGSLEFELTERAQDLVISAGGASIMPARDGLRVTAIVPNEVEVLEISYIATFEEDIAAGEIPGQVHNFSVHAHVGDDGVFLSDGSAWHPRPLDADGRPQLNHVRAFIEPIEGWTLVGSGNPMIDGDAGEAPGSRCWKWTTPRPADGMAIVGNRHATRATVHQTVDGPVEIVVQFQEENIGLAPMYLDAAKSYLDLYVPLLGAFPYQRFTIIENFFSSGFAYPGFTVLGPRVVTMAPRSLMPGFLDHELLHNWWGNGVYVSPADGNWCEALTSYCANYWRRSVEGGEEALRDYRRTTLMKLSADSDGLDDGALGTFGSADPSVDGASRFVGYDKGSFLFMMLETDARINSPHDDDSHVGIWQGLRRFATDHMGKRATWDDMRTALEETYTVDLSGYWKRWVREHTVPRTPKTLAGFSAFTAHAAPGQEITVNKDGDFVEIDPDFRFYRTLPPEQIVPLIGGTFGVGGVQLDAPDRSEVAALGAIMAQQASVSDDGENLMIVGADALERHADLIARSGDPIETDGTGFRVGGKLWSGPAQAVMHSMAHPDRPGRFITVFLANADAGWARLRLIPHYRRDTTVVWDDGQVVERRVFEPDRRIKVDE